MQSELYTNVWRQRGFDLSQQITHRDVVRIFINGVGVSALNAGYKSRPTLSQASQRNRETSTSRQSLQDGLQRCVQSVVKKRYVIHVCIIGHRNTQRRYFSTSNADDLIISRLADRGK